MKSETKLGQSLRVFLPTYGKELLICFTVRVLRGRLSICES